MARYCSVLVEPPSGGYLSVCAGSWCTYVGLKGSTIESLIGGKSVLMAADVLADLTWPRGRVIGPTRPSVVEADAGEGAEP